MNKQLLKDIILSISIGIMGILTYGVLGAKLWESVIIGLVMAVTVFMLERMLVAMSKKDSGDNQDFLQKNYRLCNVTFKSAHDKTYLHVSLFERNNDTPVDKVLIDITGMKEIDGFYMVDIVEELLVKNGCVLVGLLNVQQGLYSFLAKKV